MTLPGPRPAGGDGGPADLREAVREGREGNLVLFAVDASGSMAARQRMRAVKGAVLSLLLDAYQRRDKVGLVTFRGTGAEVALPPTSSVEAAARRLTSLATGGRTPLAAGLAQSARVLATERLRDPRRRALLVVVTDGRATSGSDADLARAAALLTGRGLTGPGLTDRADGTGRPGRPAWWSTANRRSCGSACPAGSRPCSALPATASTSSRPAPAWPPWPAS